MTSHLELTVGSCKRDSSVVTYNLITMTETKLVSSCDRKGKQMTCAATMVKASHCVGLTLPGMIELPGSFSGRINSPRPQRGPEPRYRMSFAIL